MTSRTSTATTNPSTWLSLAAGAAAAWVYQYEAYARKLTFHEGVSATTEHCVRVELDVGSEYIERADDHPAARGDVSVWVHMTTGRSAARVTARADHAPPAWCGRPVASSPPPPRSP